MGIDPQVSTCPTCGGTQRVDGDGNGTQFGWPYGWSCPDCREPQSKPRDDEQTTPDRDVPPSRRDLSRHRPDCNCLACFYRDDDNYAP